MAVDGVQVHEGKKRTDFTHLLGALAVVKHQFDLFEVLNACEEFSLDPVFQSASDEMCGDTILSPPSHHVDKEQFWVETIDSLEERMGGDKFDEGDYGVSEGV